MNTNMPKSRTKFTALPEDDRHLILKLCSAHPYHEVVDLLRQPRTAGGLNIHTSTSALCRFFTGTNPDPDRALLAQIAAATTIRHEQHANAFLGAIRATVEARVLEHLRSGRALADMEKDFKFLRTAESLYLADAKFRAENPKAARASYQNLVQRCADAPDLDFVEETQTDSDLPSDFTELSEISDFDRDILKARQRQQETLAILEKAGIHRDRPTLHPTVPIPPPAQAKTPVIPHIPLNSTKKSP